MKKILICNHKMFLTYDESGVLRKQMTDLDLSNLELIVAPSFINFDAFKGYKLCAQDCYFEDRGPYTGEISAYNLNLIGVNYSLVGHSERRKIDTDETINLKIKSLLKNSMTPILCIGETKIEKEMMHTGEVLKKQLEVALRNVKLDNSQQVMIAYEPRWVIGSGKCLNKKEIEDIFKYIKKVMKTLGIDNYKLLYGGAIDSANIKNILSDLCDGYLLGNSSVNIEELNKIIKCIK